jgi:N4-gp56 family major capsid protein
MANNFNDTVNLAQLIATQFDTSSVKPLRPNYIYDALAKEKQWDLNRNPNKGDTLQFVVFDAFSANTGALVATSTNIGQETISHTRKTVTLNLYGRHAVTDLLEANAETFVDEISDIAFSLADQGMNSMNRLARNAFDLNKYSNETSGTLSATYHAYGSYGASSSTVGPLKSKDIRTQKANLQADNVQTFPDGYYYAIIHPTQYTQLRADADQGAWSDVSENVESGANLIRRGSVGTFEGFKFFVDNEVAGASGSTISAYFLGKEGVGKAIGKDLTVKRNPTLHGPHANLMIMHWEALLGYGRIRREAIRIVECSSTKL